ncbi:PTS sugar transporter subunit IIA [bacterium]|nr:PTS sugar transporter subunit IIA [bacterium]
MKGTDLKIVDLLSKDAIASDLKADNKEDVLREMVNLLYNAGKINDKEKALEVLLDREKLGSTGVGYGVAIPHGKYNAIDNLVAAFGRSKKGIDFDAVDHKPVHIFFLFLASEDAANLHLKVLARSCRLLKRDTFRESLMHAENEDDIMKVIAREEVSMS